MLPCFSRWCDTLFDEKYYNIYSDVVIGIVGNYIEKAEVIEEAVKEGKKVLLFFSKYQDPENTIPAEEKAVQAFKKEMESKCVCCEFNGRVDFENKLINAIIQ